MAFLKSFATFVVLQIGLWGGMHFYLTANPKKALVVVDTSYAMKPHFSDATKWIDDFAGGARYTQIQVGTDKADMGNLNDLKSKDVLFRTAFGKLSTENVSNQYSNFYDTEKYLLTSEPVAIDGWNIVTW